MSDLLENPDVQVPYATNMTIANCDSTGPLSIEPYVSPEFFERERKQVFGRAWLGMGRVEQLPKANSFIVKEVEIAKASVLITRDTEGKIRAFHNVCTHRASAVAHEPCATASPAATTAGRSATTARCSAFPTRSCSSSSTSPSWA